MTAKETVKAICEALIEKKAQGIEVLHVERLTELTEYFRHLLCVLHYAG